MPKSTIPMETLINDLHGGDWIKRCDAARLLGQSRDPRAVDALLPDLKDEDWRVRRNAVQALGALKDPRALEGLIHALQDRVATVRERAAVALGRIKDLAGLPALIEALFEEKKTHLHINEGAYQAIRKFGRKAGPALVELLGRKPNIHVIDLLVESKYEGMADALRPLAAHADPLIQRRVMHVLAGAGDAAAIDGLLETLEHGRRPAQLEALRSIGSLNVKQAIPKMLQLLKDDDLFGPNTHLYHAISDAFQKLSGIQTSIQNTFPGRGGLTFNVGGSVTSLPEAMGLLGGNGFQKLNDMLANMEQNAQNLAKKIDPNVNLSPEFIRNVSSSMADQTWKFGSMLEDAREGRMERVKTLIEILNSGLALEQAAAALSLPWYLDEAALLPLEKAAQSADETVQPAAAWALRALQAGLRNQRGE